MSMTHSLGIAEIKVAASPDRIRTTLGSCVGVALFDRKILIGGMAHVLLPSSDNGKGDRGKFADTAVDWLIDEMLKIGGAKLRLVAKIAGGAAMFGPSADNGLGERNAEGVRRRLADHGIRLAGQDIGGQRGRRMMLDPTTGVVEVQVIGAEPITL
jgi:chemotaxis protein CheD